MKTFVQNILFLITGLIVGYFVGCGQRVRTIEKNTVVTKYDTVTSHVEVKIPESRTKYIFLTDTIEITKIDSALTKIVHDIEDGGPIPVNEYQDTITTEDYQLRYTIGTIGILKNFNYDVDVYRQTQVLTQVKKPKWTVGLGLSNQLHYKVGAGYRGWMVESEFRKDKFNSIWLGKQFNF